MFISWPCRYSIIKLELYLIYMCYTNQDIIFQFLKCCNNLIKLSMDPQRRTLVTEKLQRTSYDHVISYQE